jgi:heat shock protein HtpX
MNYFKTFALMTGLVMLFMLIGNMLGGRSGMILALMFAVGINFFSYWFSDKMVLMTYGAKEVQRNDAPELFAAVQRLSTNAGLPMPRVFVVEEPSPNAFATGRNPQHAVVAVTTGLLSTLDGRQLDAVLAHELSHVKHRDILTGSIAATAAGAITMIASIARWGMIFGGGSRDNDNGGIGAILMMILAPIAAFLIQMMISRSMEFAADTEAANITGRPQDLVSALESIHAGLQRQLPTHATPATQHMLIDSPFTGKNLLNLFSTHPTLEARIENLNRWKR